MKAVRGLCLTPLQQQNSHITLHKEHRRMILVLQGYYWPGVLICCHHIDRVIWVYTVNMMHIFSSPVVGVPDETGLLSVGVSGQCRPPHCGPQVAAEEAAPSRFAPLHLPVASDLDLQQVQNVPESAIESLRCLLSVRTETYYFWQFNKSSEKNRSVVITPTISKQIT